MKNVINKSVEGWEIQYLLETARSYRDTYFIIINVILGRINEGNEMLDGGMIPSVLISNGCFSIELYFKLLSSIENYDFGTTIGTFSKGHELKNLFESLNQNTKSDLEKEFKRIKYEHNYSSFSDFLNEINKGFEEGRYSFNGKDIKFNAHVLGDFLNILERYCTKSFNKISEKLVNSENKKNRNDCIKFGNVKELENIKKEYWSLIGEDFDDDTSSLEKIVNGIL